ncbi:MAG: hypothetical protein V8Q84_12545 [Bilophila sp.]
MERRNRLFATAHPRPFSIAATASKWPGWGAYRSPWSSGRWEILAQLEQNKEASPARQVLPNLLPGISLPEAKPTKKVEEVSVPEPEHPLVVALRDTNPDATTPLEALKRLTEWKLLWGAPKP